MTRPVYDPRGGRVAASERQLQQLVEVDGGRSLDPDARATLVSGRFLRPDGTLVAGLRPVVRTVAAPDAEIVLRRATWGQATRIRVRWSTHAVVVSSPHEDPDRVDELIVGAPTTLARTLWRLADLGPRPRPTTTTIVVDDALAPFRDGVRGSWAQEVGATAATLLRVEADVDGQRSASVVADLGDGGLWSPDRDQDDGTGRWRARTSTDVFGEFAGLQAALVSGTATQRT